MRVVINDVNDCRPVFSRDVYLAQLIENNYVGASVLVVTAHDDDRGDVSNSQLSYTVDGPQSNDFTVDPVTGEITVLRSLDHEATPTVTFMVVARDAGDPAMSGSATVVVRVLDVNDNSPQFDVAQYLFRVDENLPSGTLVGQLTAVDADSDANVSYVITSSSSSADDVFQLGQSSGVLVTGRRLDAELSAVYELRVTAVDSGLPARSSTAVVVVHVADVNDNRPHFVFPSSSDNVVHVSASRVTQGDTITTVTATDPDVTQSPVFYGLSDDQLGCFHVDRVSGTVSVADGRPLVDREDGWTVLLTLTATDAGGLESSATLYIVINSSAAAAAAAAADTLTTALTLDGGSAGHVMMVLCLLVVCTLMIVSLVVIITVVTARHRRAAAVKRRSHRYNCRTAACIRLQQDSAAAAWTTSRPQQAWTSTDAAAGGLQSSLLVDAPTNDMRAVHVTDLDDSGNWSQVNDASRTLIHRSPSTSNNTPRQTTVFTARRCV